MRRKIAVFLIIVVCYLLQSSVFQTISFASITPNLMIVIVSKEIVWKTELCSR